MGLFDFSGFPAGVAGDSAQARALAGGDDRAPGGQGHGRPARSCHGLDGMAFDGPAVDPGGGHDALASIPPHSLPVNQITRVTVVAIYEFMTWPGSVIHWDSQRIRTAPFCFFRAGF